ncbi:MAG: (d)CMP kinase [Candidatus Omnitrophica bacterium]|nr:(d)CMP kinase [Candidatus Omnitrophota bacterium]
MKHKNKHFVIAIDGPAGAGKSTVAKMVAEKLGFLYVDTGAMYRALTFKALKQKLDLKNKKELIDMAKKSTIELLQVKGSYKVFLDGQDVTEEIRTEEISKNSHFVACIPEIRELLWNIQRSYREHNDIVMEGRDIGTIVFPDAQLKIFLDASIEERTKRRHSQLKQQGIDIDIETLRQEIIKRDEKDRKRDIAPLKKHPNAIVIDTTNMTIEEEVTLIIDLYKKIAKESSL